MEEKWSLEAIQQFWTDNAKTHGESFAASWNDPGAIELEINNILPRLTEGDTVIDIGCANGYSTLRYAEAISLQIKGVDYIPEMIETARQQLKTRDGSLKAQAQFEVGNIMGLNEPDNAYDKAIVTRVLINLATWENQRIALQECLRVLKPGGTLLLSEATLQGWQKMNTFRQEWGLEPVPMPPHNIYLDERLITETAKPLNATVESIINFSSTYFVGTRVIKPLLAKAVGLPELEKQANLEWNRFFAMLPAFGDYGTQKLFIIKKNS